MRIGWVETVQTTISVFLMFGMLFHALPLFAADKQADSPEEQKVANEEQLLVVELFFGDRSTGIQLCYRHDDDFWIPFELFQQHARLPAVEDGTGRMRLTTTLGPIDFDLSTLREFEGERCISFTTLKETFHVHPLFNEYLYAIKILVPWQPAASLKKKKKIAVEPDIPAPDNSLSFLHLESDNSYSFHDGSIYNHFEIETGGRFGDGTWTIMTTGEPGEKLSFSRYHWTTFNRKTALRIGTGTSQMYGLVKNSDYTGAQVAWNNRNLLQNLDNERYSDTDVLLNIDRTQRRTIEGTGPPAGIAELRFDGRVAARLRISFDGRFVFRNVRMTTDLRVTEVYLYRYSTLEEPVSIIDYTRSTANRSLAGGELLFHGGAGLAGNPLVVDAAAGSPTGFAHILYGLNERMTIEGGLRHDPPTHSIDQLLGMVMSVGGRWNTALYAARSNGRFAADVSLFGSGEAWRFSQRSLWHQPGFGYETGEQKERHALRLQIRLFSWLNAFVYGNYTKENGSVTSRHLLPGGHLHLFPRTRLSVIPDDGEGTYHYEASLQPRRDTDVQLRYEDRVITANVDYDFRNGSNSMQFYHSYAPKKQMHASSTYFNWYPRSSRNDRIRLGASYTHGRFGFSGSWSRDINTGLSIALSYYDNMFNAGGLSIEDSPYQSDIQDNRTISLSLTWDLGRSGKRFYPINRTAISHTRGGMAGALKIMTDSKISRSQINDVSILLNGKKLGQRQIGGDFFVGNLRPGIYTVSVDPENLPLELVVEQQSIKVEVQSGAVTEVNIPVYAEYGAAGKVITASGHALAGVPIRIADSENKTTKQVMTDQFGYYRIDGLRQGSYTAKIMTTKEDKPDHITETKFVITDDFLFEIDIIVPEPSSFAP